MAWISSNAALRMAVAAIGLFAVMLAAHFAVDRWPATMPAWTEEERALMATLTLDALPDATATGNAVAESLDAAEFGHRLFFDTRLSGTGTVACITCHQPARQFTDGLQKARAIGESKRHTPSIVGAAYSPWLYWDGRRDSLWSQALSPLEDASEHGGNRMGYVRFIASDPEYRERYTQLFGPLPDVTDTRRFPQAASPLGSENERAAWERMTPTDRLTVDAAFANLGKAIAAYERRLLPAASRFDRYVAALDGNDNEGDEFLTPGEAQGLRLFLGKARCMECHNGPLFTNNEFHNTGILSAEGELPDRGRIDGIRQVRSDRFNCKGEHNDAPTPYCGELEFARDGVELIGAFRTPSLRNSARTPPYMHKGQLATLDDVIDHYNRSPLAMIGHNEAEDPLALSSRERRQLVNFLHTLDSPVEETRWLERPRYNDMNRLGDRDGQQEESR